MQYKNINTTLIENNDVIQYYNFQLKKKNLVFKYSLVFKYRLVFNYRLEFKYRLRFKLG